MGHNSARKRLRDRGSEGAAAVLRTDNVSAANRAVNIETKEDGGRRERDL